MLRKLSVASLAATLCIPAYFAVADGPPSSSSIAFAGDDKEHKHSEAEKHKLGRQQIGEYTVSVIMVGEAEAGKEVEFDIKLIDAKSDPKAMWVWIGKQDAPDGEKAKATKGEKTYDADVTVPASVSKDAKVWVALETAKGVVTGSFEMDKHDHKH